MVGGDAATIHLQNGTGVSTSEGKEVEAGIRAVSKDIKR